MDNLKNFRRTNYCGELRLSDAGKTVSLCGWVQRQRDLGGLIFVDLRDRTGLVQLSFDDSTAKDIFEKASTLRSEYVVAATGLVRERESKTNKIATGDIEVYVSELRLLAKAETPPFRDRGELQGQRHAPPEVPLSGPAPPGYAACHRHPPQGDQGGPGLLRRAGLLEIETPC